MAFVIDDPVNPTGPAANPLIQSNIIIEANGSRIEHVPNGINFRAFAVDSNASLAIRNAHIKGFTVKGGDGARGGGGGMGAGGAIYIFGGTLSIESCAFEGNGAAGGNGGNNPGFRIGGGGGGLAGNGGAGDGNFGGGGGGSRGDGLFGGGGTMTSATGDSAGGFDCGGDAGGAILVNGHDGGCAGGGGGGGAESTTVIGFGGNGGNGAYGAGGGGGGAGESDGSGGDGGDAEGSSDLQGSADNVGGGGGSGGTLQSGLLGGPFGGNGGFGAGGGAGYGCPGTGGKFGGDASQHNGGGGAGLGGAVFNDSGTVRIYNSTFTQNFVVRGCKGDGCNGADTAAHNGQDEGGAVFARNGTLEVYNATISGNESTGEGGGLVVVQTSFTIEVGGVTQRIDPPTSFLLRNTILANATARECFFQGPAVTNEGSGNLIRNNFGCPGNIAANPADPQLGPLQINPPGSTPTMAINMNSPALDAGDDTHPPAYLLDQRGVSRPQSAHIDIGAYEFAACSGVACPADITQSNDPGECGAVVNYSATGVGDDCGTVSCSVPSGSFFPVGTTAVTCSSTAGPSCSFNVTVNDTENPRVTTPANIRVGNTPGQCSAAVNPGSAVANDNCPGATVSGVRNDGQPLNAPYPTGTTTITWTATDAHGRTSAPATQTVTVRDAQAPSVSNISTSPAVLRPPDHSLRAMAVNYTAADNCSAPTCTLSVTSNEPIRGIGSGDTGPDWQIIDAHHVRLRSERSGTGNGRIYTIKITCRDGTGNTTTKTTQVKVPK
jgi:hypothetical protein